MASQPQHLSGQSRLPRTSSFTIAGVATKALRGLLSRSASSRVNLRYNIHNFSSSVSISRTYEAGVTRGRSKFRTLVGFRITSPSLTSFRMFCRELAAEISVTCEWLIEMAVSLDNKCRGFRTGRHRSWPLCKLRVRASTRALYEPRSDPSRFYASRSSKSTPRGVSAVWVTPSSPPAICYGVLSASTRIRASAQPPGHAELTSQSIRTVLSGLIRSSTYSQFSYF